MAEKLRDLSADCIAGLLRAGPLRFAVADLGHPLDWVAEADRFTFWKEEAKPRIADPVSEGFHLDGFSGQYAYVASEWAADPGSPIILLEKHH